MIYLNNAATSYPKPKEVLDEVYKHCLMMPVHSSRTGLEKEEEDVDYAARMNLAKLFNAKDPLNIVFTSGSTEALNLAIKGLELNGGHVISTQIEHNSVIRPLNTLASEGVIEVDFVECDEYAYVKPENIDKAFKENTRAVVVNHCSNVTGTVLDIKAIAETAHSHGVPIIVDASQSTGHIPIDVTGWDIDYLAFTGHKSLYGLPGIGGLYMKEPFSLTAFKTGGTGVKSEILTQPREMTMYYEAGTQNAPGIASLKAGTDFLFKKGMNRMHEQRKRHVRKMMNELGELPEITLYIHPEHSCYSNFVFNIKGMVPEEVNYALESSYDIHVRSGLHCAPLLLDSLGAAPWGTVRASPSYFTTDEEVDKFISAVKDIIESFVNNK